MIEAKPNQRPIVDPGVFLFTAAPVVCGGAATGAELAVGPQ
jgi:hypothetical protein